MADTDRSKRTEQPTPKRKHEARTKGQVARSRELGTVSILLATLIAFHFYGARFLHHLGELMQWLLRSSGELTIQDSNLVSLLFQIEKKMLPILAPIILLMAVFALATNFGQVGFLLTTQTLKPDLGKLNPITGFWNLFSLRSLAELIKSLLKVGVIGFIAYKTIMEELPGIPLLSAMAPGSIFYSICAVSFRILLRSTIALLIMAILDYIYQRYEWNKSLMMTKEEVKEEMRQAEGDPKVRAQIRKIQQRIARQRMMAHVPQADVVITNPQHLAVALRYDARGMAAPTVIAKGAGFVAEKIKEIAREHGIPLVENKPLAQLLYKTVDIGKAIPPHLYQAVAEILAYVYRLKPEKYGR
ncbi:MAG: flagellar biosynthesis protein FlhB [bacterium]